MKRKIVNYLIINRVISRDNFLKLIVLYNLLTICLSLKIYFIDKAYNIVGFRLDDIYSLAQLMLLFYVYPYKALLEMNITVSIVISSMMCLTVNFLFIYLFKKIYPLSKIQEQNLVELGFGYVSKTEIKDSNGIIRIIKKFFPAYFIEYEDYIDLGGHNLKQTIPEVQDILPSISNTLRIDLSDVISSSVKNGQLVFKITKNRFSLIDNTKLSTVLDFKKPILQLGWDTQGNPKCIDIKTDFSFGLFGESGSGKSVFTKELIFQFLEQGYEVVIADVNLVDYKEIRKCKRVTYFDVSSIEGLKAFDDYFLDLIAVQIPKAKEILEGEGVTHPLELQDRSLYNIKPTLIFIDEARAVINPKKETRKDFQTIKKSITTNFETGLSQFRKFGICLGLATQRLQVNELGIDFSNIKILLANGVDKPMNSKWCNGEMNEVIKGRWYLAKSESTTKGMIKSPFTKPDFSKFQNNVTSLIASKIPDAGVVECNQSTATSIASSYEEVDLNEIEIIRTTPSKKKYSSTHEFVIVRKNGKVIYEKLVLLGRSDEEIFKGVA